MSESQNIEWKRIWKDDYIKWICGFANANGGRLIIGKDDEGTIVGLRNAKKLMEDLPNKIKSSLGLVLDVNLHSAKSKEWITIEVPPQAHPISYKGQYFYRSGSTKQELKGAALNRFLLQKQGLKWDGLPVTNVAIQQLSECA